MNENLINGLILAFTIVVTIAVGGGIAAVIELLRTRKREVERAFLSLPPEIQAKVLEIVKTANDVAAAAAAILAYLTEVTDGTIEDMETLEGAEAALARADRLKLQAQARIETLKSSAGRL